MVSKFDFYHVIGWTVGRLILILFSGGMFLASLMLFEEKHWSVYLVTLFSGYVLAIMLMGFWRFYPSYRITEVGLQRRNILGLGFSYFYKWSQLTSYKVDSYTSGGKAGGLKVTAIYIYAGRYCVAKIDNRTYKNYEDLYSEVKLRMKGKEK